jgi:hypothetical protein
MKNDLAKNLPLALHLHFWYLFGDFNYQLFLYGAATIQFLRLLGLQSFIITL